MYQIENSGQVIKQRGRRGQGAGRPFSRPVVSRTVILLGLTSLFSDISSEMVATILPLYVLFSLSMSPLAFGILDGLYLGAAALVRIAGGFAADRSRRLKEVAVAGYALSTLSRVALLAAGGAWLLLAAVVLVDRLGKGIRTAPRDALISLSSPPAGQATAFGVHRALDTTGAMLGPLLAFGILSLAPGSYDAVFVVSFCAALLGLGIITLFVSNPPATSNTGLDDNPALTRHNILEMMRAPEFARLLVIGTGLSLATISDGFIYLTLQRRLDLSIGFFPLLYVATALIFMVLAVPVGLLADRVGRGRTFVAGYALLLGVYVSLLLPWAGAVQVVVALVLLGTYYAATDGMLMALASAITPEEQRTSGFALLTTATSLARLVSSIAFGLLWTWQSVNVALVVFVIALAAGVAMTAFALRTPWERESLSDA